MATAITRLIRKVIHATTQTQPHEQIPLEQTIPQKDQPHQSGQPHADERRLETLAWEYKGPAED